MGRLLAAALAGLSALATFFGAGLAMIGLCCGAPALAAAGASTAAAITLGNLATGALWDYAERNQALWLVWTVQALTGGACAGAVLALARTGRLTAPVPQPALA